jgi:hypothetical protein
MSSRHDLPGALLSYARSVRVSVLRGGTKNGPGISGCRNEDTENIENIENIPVTPVPGRPP